MGEWTSDELERIGAAEEAELGVLRGDGTPREPVTVWVVRDGEDLYVRSWLGSGARWFRAARARPEGRLSAAGVERNVGLVDADDDDLNDGIDDAYRAKYERSSHAGEMVRPDARATTLRLVPR